MFPATSRRFRGQVGGSSTHEPWRHEEHGFVARCIRNFLRSPVLGPLSLKEVTPMKKLPALALAIFFAPGTTAATLAQGGGGAGGGSGGAGGSGAGRARSGASGGSGTGGAASGEAGAAVTGAASSSGSSGGGGDPPQSVRRRGSPAAPGTARTASQGSTGVNNTSRIAQRG